jgi:hypothetical protein
MRLKISLAVIFLLVMAPSWSYADIFGIKTQAPAGGTVAGSMPPTNFFSFKEDGSGFTDYGAMKLDGNDVNLDALAYSPNYGFRAYELRNDASYNVTGSRLVSINPQNLTITPLSQFQDNRHIRGAVFVKNELWILDVTSSMALKVDPNNGAELAAKTVSPPISDCCDLAVSRNGTVYLVNYDYAVDQTKVYTLNLSSGALTLVHTQAGESSTYVGAAFSMNAPESKLFVFDVAWATTNDDIFVHDISGFNRTLLYPNIIPGFNAGRGDLASVMRQPGDVVGALFSLILDN